MIRFLEVAQQELDEAVAFHEGQVIGLGRAFLDEVLAALELMHATRRLGTHSALAPGVAVCGVFPTG